MDSDSARAGPGIISVFAGQIPISSAELPLVPIHSIMFEARLTQGSLLKKLIESIRELVTDANFDVSSSGIPSPARAMSIPLMPRLPTGRRRRRNHSSPSRPAGGSGPAGGPCRGAIWILRLATPISTLIIIEPGSVGHSMIPSLGAYSISKFCIFEIGFRYRRCSISKVAS